MAQKKTGTQFFFVKIEKVNKSYITYMNETIISYLNETIIPYLNETIIHVEDGGLDIVKLIIVLVIIIIVGVCCSLCFIANAP